MLQRDTPMLFIHTDMVAYYLNTKSLIRTKTGQIVSCFINDNILVRKTKFTLSFQICQRYVKLGLYKLFLTLDYYLPSLAFTRSYQYTKIDLTSSIIKISTPTEFTSQPDFPFVESGRFVKNRFNALSFPAIKH